MKNNINAMFKSLHFDDDPETIDINSEALNYINSLKVGKEVEFQYKLRGSRKKPDNLTGKVVAVYNNKFCLNVELKNRQEPRIITFNDICDGTYREVFVNGK